MPKWLSPLLFVCSLAFASDSTSLSVSGAVATVQHIDASAGTATIQTTSASKKDISGYVIVAATTYADGRSERREHGHDYGPRITYERFGVLRSGMSSQDVVRFAPSADETLQTIDVRVVVVIFSDQTAEVTDERAFENHMRARREAASELNQSVDILRAVLKDGSDERPSSKAADLAKAAILSAKASSEKKDMGFLGEMQKHMEQTRDLAMAANVSEREFVKQYLSEEEAKAASFAEYCDVRRRK